MPQQQVPDQKTLNELLEKHETSLLALDVTELKLPRVSRERVLEQTHWLLDQFEPFKGSLDDEFSQKKSTALKTAHKELGDVAFVFYAASLAAEQDWSQDDKDAFKALASNIKNTDALYMKWGRAIFHGDQAKNEALDAIQSGRGYVDDAEDVIALSRMLLALDAKYFPNPFFSKDELRNAEVNARKFLWYVHGRDENKPPTGSPPDMRVRAYTYWQNMYNMLARAGRSLIEDEKEAKEKFPSVFAARDTKQEATVQDENNTNPLGL